MLPWKGDWERENLLSKILDIAIQPSCQKNLLVHCLYIVVNIAGGTDQDKIQILDAKWFDMMSQCLQQKDPDIIEATTWLIQNLVCENRTDDSRIGVFNALGVRSLLEVIAGNPNQTSITERAMIALREMQKRQTTSQFCDIDRRHLDFSHMDFL